MSEKVTFTESLPLLLVEMFWLDQWSSSIIEASSKIWKSEKWKFVYKENMRHCNSLDPQPSTISWSCSWLNLKLWTACHGHQNSTCFYKFSDDNILMWYKYKFCMRMTTSSKWPLREFKRMWWNQLWCMRSTSQYRSCHFQILTFTVSTSDCAQ